MGTVYNKSGRSASGNLNITSNGSHNVAKYKTVSVNVPDTQHAIQLELALLDKWASIDIKKDGVSIHHHTYTGSDTQYSPVFYV